MDEGTVLFNPPRSLAGSWEGTGQYSRPLLPDLGRSRGVRTMLIADIFEFVRLFEADEKETLARWVAILAQIEASIFIRCNGLQVKSLGDGVLLVFEQVGSALSAAFAIQQVCQYDNVGRQAERQIMLRIGIETGDVLVLQQDVFGQSVNLAARLATLAGPGEIVVSARVREQLTPMLDANIEDLGECYLKHISKPVRAFRVGPPGPRPALAPFVAHEDMLPAIAVVPFVNRDAMPEHHLTGDVLAEELIRDLSRSLDLRVISRLSTATFRHRGLQPDAISAHLNAEYMLSGTYVVRGHEIKLSANLVEAATARIMWSTQLLASLASLVEGERETLLQLVKEIRSAVMVREVERTRDKQCRR